MIEALKKLQDHFKNHLEIKKKYIASTAELSLEIATFFHRATGTEVKQRTSKYGKINAGLERIQLGSIEKLYQEEVLQPMEVLWHHDKEVLKAVKDRKRLLKLENKKLGQWHTKQNELKSAQEAEKKLRATGAQKPKPGRFNKKKDVTEVSEEVLQKKNSYEATVKEREELTRIILGKFINLQKNFNEGDLISSPVSGIVASQYHLTNVASAQLSEIGNQFREFAVFSKTLQKYAAYSVVFYLILCAL